MYLGQVVPYARQIIKDALKHIGKSERAFRKDEERSYNLLLIAADDLDRAANYLRGYVDQMRQPD